MIKYSDCLGVINVNQFQMALEKFNLGKFVKAEKVPFGSVGQNVFLTSTEGDFVLRGNPFYSHQFAVEKFMVDNLHERTDVPVPWPYLLDTSTDIFGWKYVIMPRMPGLPLADGNIKGKINKENRKKIARLMGETLARMQEFTWDFSGIHTDDSTVKPFEPSYGEWIIQGIRRHLEEAREISNITIEDVSWIDNLIAQNKEALHVPFQPCFVMGDYKEDNVVVSCNGGNWCVSGVFDFAMSHFGDGEFDLTRLYAMYLDEDPALAKEFVSTYMHCKTPREGFVKRLQIYILNERLTIWEWAKRAKIVWWEDKMSLRDWIEPYIAIEQLNL